jgi:flagellar motor switch protein FliN
MADEQAPVPPTPPSEPAAALAPASDAASQALKAAQEAIARAKAMQSEPEPVQQPTPVAAAEPAGTQPFSMPSFGTAPPAKPPEGIEMLGDVNLQVKIELGRTRMLVEDVLKLGEGAVVELDKLAGDPVDIYVNDRPVARGEVLVLNDNFCVRINEILAAPEARA